MRDGDVGDLADVDKRYVGCFRYVAPCTDDHIGQRLKFTEVRGQSIRCPRVTVSNAGPCTICEHVLWRVETPTGRVYALDFSGAQFGIFQPLMLWDQYVDMINFVLLKAAPGGTRTSEMKGLELEALQFGWALNIEYAKCLAEFLHKWVEMDNINVLHEMRSVSRKFEDFRKRFIEECDAILKFCMNNEIKHENLVIIDGITHIKDHELTKRGIDLHNQPFGTKKSKSKAAKRRDGSKKAARMRVETAEMIPRTIIPRTMQRRPISRLYKSRNAWFHHSKDESRA